MKSKLATVVLLIATFNLAWANQGSRQTQNIDELSARSDIAQGGAGTVSGLHAASLQQSKPLIPDFSKVRQRVEYFAELGKKAHGINVLVYDHVPVSNRSPIGSGPLGGACFITLSPRDWNNWAPVTSQLNHHELDAFVDVALAHELAHCLIMKRAKWMAQKYPAVFKLANEDQRNELLADIFALDWARENQADWREISARWLQFRERTEAPLHTEYVIAESLKAYLVQRDSAGASNTSLAYLDEINSPSKMQ